MYGSSSGDGVYGGGGSGSGSGVRKSTPRGQMTIGLNNKPALLDLYPHIAIMFRLPEIEAPTVGLPKRFEPDSEEAEDIIHGGGVADYMKHFEKVTEKKEEMMEVAAEAADGEAEAKSGSKPPMSVTIHPSEARFKKRNEAIRANERKVRELDRTWDPRADPNIKSDAYSTIFVGHLSPDTTEAAVEGFFRQFGELKNDGVRLVRQSDGKSRRYAFVEFEKEEEMIAAVRLLTADDGRKAKLDGHHVTVDVERGRTVKMWRPRKLGGGKGGRLSRMKKGTKRRLRQDAFYVEKQEVFKRYRESGGLSAGGDADREGDWDRDRDRGRDRDNYRDRDRDGGHYRDRREYSRDRYGGDGRKRGRDDREDGGYRGGGRRRYEEDRGGSGGGGGGSYYGRR